MLIMMLSCNSIVCLALWLSALSICNTFHYENSLSWYLSSWFFMTYMLICTRILSLSFCDIEHYQDFHGTCGKPPFDRKCRVSDLYHACIFDIFMGYQVYLLCHAYLYLVKITISQHDKPWWLRFLTCSVGMVNYVYQLNWMKRPCIPMKENISTRPY